MKKALLFTVLLILCGYLWGADFTISTGAGGLVGSLFTRYKASGSSGSGEMTQEINQFNYGGLVFFDATYGELAVIIQGGANNYDEVMSKNGAMAPSAGDGWETMLGFSLLGKYPFTFTQKLRLFPLLGIEYQIAISQRRNPSGGLIYDRTNGVVETDKDGKAFSISDWNAFWINLGVGADYHFSRGLFVRGEFLYGFRLMTPYEVDGLDQMKSMLADNDPKLSGLTSGPSLRLATGFRFLNM